MSTRLIAGAVLALLLLAACSDNSGRTSPTPTPAFTSPTPATPAPTPTRESPLRHLRVAYLNLKSPLDDFGDEAAQGTFAERLEIAIEDFERFGADIVAVSEATWVEGQGRSAWERLNSGLQMEGHYVRANPWDEGQTPDESDQTVALRGFEEGEYLLSRFPFGTTKGYPLEPRTDFHERRVVLHAVLKVDEPVGEVDVFVTRLDGDEATRNAQAQHLLTIIADVHDPNREVLVLGDLGLPPDSPLLPEFRELGYVDAAAAADPPMLTCCREAVLVPAPTGEPEQGDDAEPTAEGEETPVPGAETPIPEQPEPGPYDVQQRTDYVLAGQWTVESVQPLAADPRERPDGSWLYASDHVGVGVVFDLSLPAEPQ